MNKYEIITIPEDIDITNNPYKFEELNVTLLTKVDYDSELVLDKGEYAYDTDERAYWIKPGENGGATATVGYIKFIDNRLRILPGDDIEVEFEIKYIGDATGQLSGVTIDILNTSNVLQGTLQYIGRNYSSNEYDYVKIKKRINAAFTTASKCRVVVGTISSPVSATGYSYKIRNIKITIIRNSASLIRETVPEQTGLGVANFSIDKLTDNANVYPTSGARDISLKSGIYGFSGGGAANGSLSSAGLLIVLPYRADGVGGNNYVEQLVMINSPDADAGLWHRSYNGATTTWSSWRRYGEFVPVPASATAAGKPGDMAADANFLYICHTSNTWKRVAIDSW